MRKTGISQIPVAHESKLGISLWESGNFAVNWECGLFQYDGRFYEPCFQQAHQNVMEMDPSHLGSGSVPAGWWETREPDSGERGLYSRRTDDCNHAASSRQVLVSTLREETSGIMDDYVLDLGKKTHVFP